MIDTATDERTSDEEVSIGDLLSRLIDDTEQFVRAEFGLYRAQAIKRFSQSWGAIGMVVVAVVLLQAAVIALLVGAIIALAPVIGGFWAMVLVLAVAIGVATLLLSIAWRRLRAVMFTAENARERD